MILTREKLEKQPPYYYPQNFNVFNWTEISAAFDELEFKQIETPRDLLTILYQCNELMSLLYEIYNDLYFRTLAYTKDDDAHQKLAELIQNVILPSEKRNLAILKRYYDHPLRQQLNQDYYRQLNRYFESQIAHIDIEDTETTLELNDLIREYRQLYNQVQVNLNGESYSINIISHILSQAEPGEREAIWQARKTSCLQNREKFHAILDSLIKARNKTAKEAGYPNYYDFSLSTTFLSGMTLSQIKEIHSAVRSTILPVVRQFVKQRQKRQNLKTIRPWDLEADPEAAALVPFTTTDELVEKAISVLYDIRFEYGILLNKMFNTGVLDLEFRPDKVKGEFNGIMPFWNAGRILMSCTGHHRDMVMLFHEMGHVLQSTSLWRNPLSLYYILPVQARELASQTLVYLSTQNWDVFYPDKKDRKTAFRSLYEYDLMEVLYWSIMNSFELTLYSNPDWTYEQREKAMVDIWKQYDFGVDWKGLEDWLRIFWVQEFTLFEFPHYSFLSSLSIFNVWQILRNYRHDPLDTVSRFQHFLEKAADLSQDQMFHELNIKQDYSAKHMQKMVDFIQREYKKIGG